MVAAIALPARCARALFNENAAMKFLDQAKVISAPAMAAPAVSRSGVKFIEFGGPDGVRDGGSWRRLSGWRRYNGLNTR